MLGWVYGIQSAPFIKIGVAHNIRVRLHAMRLHNPHPLTVVLRRRCENPYWIERRMHQILASHALGREWFDITPEQARALPAEPGETPPGRVIERAPRTVVQAPVKETIAARLA